MHDTTIPATNPHGFRCQIQTLQFPAHLPTFHPCKEYEGKAKGLKVVLQERGLIKEVGRSMVNVRTGNKIIGECAACKKKKSRNSQLQSISKDEQDEVDADEMDDTEEEDAVDDCCMKKMLGAQENFKSEKSLLEKVSTLFIFKGCMLTCFHEGYH